MSTSNVKLPPLSPRTFVSANTHNNTNNGISRKSSVPSILVNENKLPPLSLGQCPPPQNSSIQQNPANAENTDNKSNTGESVHTVTANVPNDTVFKREFSFANATKKTLANDDSNDHNNNNNNNNKDDQEKREEAEASGGETTNDPREKDVVMVDADRKDVGISLSQQMSSDKSQGSKNEEDKKRMSISNLLA
ncbi:hypothetical protein PACTADRAFT_74658 [Pachysolen tannophilus NRRL Y-2460]|uniref:Uncharacterized protein n=1 Tax=Pachysolen tannophilus NRRL Y-2460 TaxID=669874 RepID=A0A1E4TZH6_PACTA|nr:hypothetical protein PACTADRAFT_74658 [Pachysolen tannophilus NRRL Y-2460]